LAKSQSGWTILRLIQAASQSIPANSEALTATTNGIQERSNSPLALLAHSALNDNGGGVNRMRKGKGIVSKAKALGNARDKLTETRSFGR
jgi:hypothetical protein